MKKNIIKLENINVTYNDVMKASETQEINIEDIDSFVFAFEINKNQEENEIMDILFEFWIRLGGIYYKITSGFCSDFRFCDSAIGDGVSECITIGGKNYTMPFFTVFSGGVHESAIEYADRLKIKCYAYKTTKKNTFTVSNAIIGYKE